MSDLSYWLNYMLIQILSIVFLIKTLSPLVLLEPAPHPDPSPRKGPQDLPVTLYDCEENQQKKHYIKTQLIK